MGNRLHILHILHLMAHATHAPATLAPTVGLHRSNRSVGGDKFSPNYIPDPKIMSAGTLTA
jgi:hypothetical protein